MSRSDFCWFVGLTAALLAVVYALTPWALDDYVYLEDCGSLTSVYDRLAQSWANTCRHWLSDTGRLANLVAPVALVLVPKWLYGLMCGVAWWWSVWLGVRLSGIRPGGLWSVLVVTAWLVALPWLDYQFTVMHSLNYLWSTMLTLLFLYWLSRPARSYGAARLAAMCLVCLIAGWMHEGFTAPVLVGLGTVWLWRRPPLGRAKGWLCASYAAGLFLIFIAPAFWARLGRGVNLFDDFTPAEALVHALAFNILGFIFLAVLVICLIIKPLRLRIFGQTVAAFPIFCAVAVIAASVLYYKFYAGPRMGWWPTILASLGLASLCRALWGEPNVKFVVWLLALLCVSHLCEVVVEQWSLNREEREIRSRFLASRDGTVFYDNSPTSLTPTLLKTSTRAFNEPMPMEAFSEYWAGVGGKQLTLLPERLCGFNTNECIRLQADSTLYLYKDLLLCHGPVDCDTLDLWLLTPQLGEVTSRVRGRQVRADGSDWTLLLPHVATYAPITITDAHRVAKH